MTRGSSDPPRMDGDAAVRFRIPPPPRPPLLVAYVLAVLLPLGALAVQNSLRAWVEPIPFVLFFFVVSIVSTVGGWGPGLLSVAASSVSGWLFLSAAQSPDRAAGALVGAAVFAPVGAVIAVLGALVREGFHERDRAAHTLAEAVRVRDRFISVASHELKTPLTSLTLSVQRLARRRSDDRELLRLVDGAERQTGRLAFLVNNLLDVSRITSGRLHVDLEPVDLAQVVRDVAADFEAELDRSGSALRLELRGAVVGRWDRVRLEQILTNLLSNAVKYGARSDISVSVRTEAEAAVLAVADGGIGVPQADHERIFERFERGSHGSAPGGFGVGLWIVREITIALGGTVAVDSAPGHGATFTVVLPLAGPPAASTRQ